MGPRALDTPPGGQSATTGSLPANDGPPERMRGTLGDWSVRIEEEEKIII